MRVYFAQCSILTRDAGTGAHYGGIAPLTSESGGIVASIIGNDFFVFHKFRLPSIFAALPTFRRP